MTVIFGTSGDDTLVGGSGDDILVGFDGKDLAVFSGASFDYRFDWVGGYLTVTDLNLADGDDGTDQLVGIESLGFGDRFLGISSTGEVRVNTATAADQSHATITGLADGGYVIAWNSDAQDGSWNGVYAQRYDASGVANGGEFLVNSTTDGAQQNASVADLANGGFVVSWESWDSDVARWNIHAQSYAANGQMSGPELLVNSTTINDQGAAVVTGLAGGGFVISWQSWEQDGSGYGVYAQRYAADGTAQGNEFLVNTTTIDFQATPAITGLADGGFVISWESWNQDGGGAGVYGQRFAASGAALGAEFIINTTTQEWQLDSAVTALSDGGFVVTWQSWYQDGSEYGIYAQRFNAAGAMQGAEFRVNGSTDGNQSSSAVAALADGGFAVAWVASDGDGSGIYLRCFDAAGAAGAETLVNSTITGDQLAPAIAALADGGFVVSWESSGQDGSGSGIYSQRFDAGGAKTPPALQGTADADSLDLSGAGNLWAAGMGGDDTYTVNTSGDRVFENAGQGMDTVNAMLSWTLGANLENLVLLGSDALQGIGNSLANDLLGNSGNNLLSGCAGSDTLDGGIGNDTLNGGAGPDYMTGGKGADVFVFDRALGQSNIDTITDFRSEVDTISLDDDIFTAFNAGVSTVLQAGQYYQHPGSTSAHDANDRIILNTSTGALYYDADGAGGVAAVQFAVVLTSNHSGLEPIDFIVSG